MLTDAFFRRYEDVTLWHTFDQRERRFLGQAAQLISDEVLARDERNYKEAEKDPAMRGIETAMSKLARELGVAYLVAPTFEHSWTVPNGNKFSRQVARRADNKSTIYLTEVFKENYSPDLFMKFRVSYIELAMQERASQLEARKSNVIANMRGAGSELADLYDALSGGDSWAAKQKADIQRCEKLFVGQVHELNERFRQAKIPLSFHNNLIQVSDDALLEKQLEAPFWSLVSDSKWAIVDQQMKESLDERDRGERNAVSNAFNALESAVKIISTDKGWTTGNERGAANFIDNLVKERDGVRFIEVWEKEVLVKLFSDVRNRFGHGPAGGQSLPMLLPQQTAWAIDTCMVWIKSLIRRA
ncbi:AbiJ-NTD4 domain-containing protein [Paraburkholderia sediminicola]|uniref:AbiJ-NTD4 domain-containing protein n=1 Tax=Paraburkholderia sediminicola TaxID=458836 RepID=UPI0038BB52E3